MRNRLTIAAIVVLALLTSHLLRAQAPTTQSPAIPQWQTDAGGKMAFDVASVKPNKSGNPGGSNVPLGPGNVFTPAGGLFSATNQPLIVYVRFAYKLGQDKLVGLPDWVNTDSFDIEARGQATATKDQMRLMMQSLLADRFKLAMHTESQQKAVYAIVLVKPRKTGPQLQAHSDAQPYSTLDGQAPGTPPPAKPSAPSSTSGLQLGAIPCGGILGGLPTSTPGLFRFGGRDIPMALITRLTVNPLGGLDRPTVDRTGLSGTFDFSLEFTPPPNPAQPSSAQPEDTGPTFREALQEQLGLKLEPVTAPVDVIVVDHVEEPSPN